MPNKIRSKSRSAEAAAYRPKNYSELSTSMGSGSRHHGKRSDFEAEQSSSVQQVQRRKNKSWNLGLQGLLARNRHSEGVSSLRDDRLIEDVSRGEPGDAAKNRATADMMLSRKRSKRSKGQKR